MSNTPVPTAMLALALLAPAVAHAEVVEVDCEEYQEMMGREMPCDAFKTLKMPQSSLDKAYRKLEERQCIEAVWEEYGENACEITVQLWSAPNDSPEDDDENAACTRAVHECNSK